MFDTINSTSKNRIQIIHDCTCNILEPLPKPLDVADRSLHNS
nr:MAG TPA: hypothetical protein [Bacteriophage sp.]DAP28944.1 MAG TPA: hypothetical protein [Caudoviricetes sp.]